MPDELTLEAGPAPAEQGRCEGSSTSALLAVHFSSTTDEWPTPQWLFDALHKEFGFTLDVCSTHENAKCAKHYTREDDGLKKPWAAEVCWMNPPYGEAIKAWMARAHDAAMHEGSTVVCLVPARTDTAWWHEYAMKHEIRFLRGRLKFGEATDAAPFPSAVIVMRPATFRLMACPANAELRDAGEGVESK